MYEQFSEIDVEAELYTKRQHTPNFNKQKKSLGIDQGRNRVTNVLAGTFLNSCSYILRKSYPAAQLPLAVPPLSEHSVAVKQVPFLLTL